MLKSMTGYGRSQKILNGRDILVEIRSVNHRYFEYSSKIPRAYVYIDDKLKSLIKTCVSRGKVEVSVTVSCIDGKETVIGINKSVVKGYVDALRSIEDEMELDDNLQLSNIIKLPDIFTVRKAPDDEDEIWEDISCVTNEALLNFVEMRTAEGEKLKSDLIGKAELIKSMIGEVEKLSPCIVENYQKRLFSKLSDVLEGRNIDEQRILTEAAIFADKIAVDEETVRMRSHISQFEDMLNASEPVGRKLDFLVQEMNREVNTIGSKSQALSVTKIVVDMKAEIEKIREQIQNVE